MTEATNPYGAPQAALDINTKVCRECAASIRKAAEICPQCGVRQTRPVSKTALALLAFFTGGFGGHKFYLRKWVQGIFYLLFAVTGIPGLIALVEFFIYLFASEERLNERYPEGSAGGVAIAVIAAFVGLMMIGIVAAITIPAYSDYTGRAHTAEAIVLAVPVRTGVAEHYANKRAWPATLKEIDITPDPLTDQRGNRITLKAAGVIEISVANQQGNTIIYVPSVDGTQVTWDCTGGTLAKRHRPAVCRK